MFAEFAAMARDTSVGVADLHSAADVLSAVGQTGTVIAVMRPPLMVATTCTLPVTPPASGTGPTATLEPVYVPSITSTVGNGVGLAVVGAGVGVGATVVGVGTGVGTTGVGDGTGVGATTVGVGVGATGVGDGTGVGATVGVGVGVTTGGSLVVTVGVGAGLGDVTTVAPGVDQMRAAEPSKHEP